MVIDSKATLEEAARFFGVLPFFRNPVKGFSVEEMAAPGMLFGDNGSEEGCWEWKGPVIRERTTAYGKFFHRKAGFVTLELLPHFLNYRRNTYKIPPASTDEMILEIIRENEGLTSTDLKNYIFGFRKKSRKPWDLPGEEIMATPRKRSSLETPLQRLQMAGRILISDFEYKLTKRGQPYGWGVAKYSTPEIWLGEMDIPECSPQESLEFIVKYVEQRVPGANKKIIRQLLM